MSREHGLLFWIGLLVVGLVAAGAAQAQGANPTGVSTDDPATQPPPAQPAQPDPAEALSDTLEQLQGEGGEDLLNPFVIGENAGDLMNALLGPTRGVVNDDLGTPDGLASQGVGSAPGSESDGGKSGLSSTLSVMLLLTVLTMVPAVLVMCTSFTRIVVVLALLRQALGTQQLPPTQVITGLALFLTLLVMSPTLNQINNEVLKPLNAGTIDETEAWEKTKAPLRDFMFRQIDRSGNWGSVYTIMEWREPGITAEKGDLRREDVDMLTLVPAFMISELKVAFLMGFRLYLPFLVIDMVVSSVLISMGMLMLPPVLISLPFKLLLFVLVDGWNLLVANLLTSFDVGALPAGAG
jgi:flagellar biosynthetic protein FliP